MTDREKLIELLRSNMNVLKAAGTSATATLRLADNLIANGVTVAYKLSPTEPLTNCQQWIPVTERLPADDGWVLCWKKDGDCWMARWNYCYDRLWSDGEYWCGVEGVTHWMPLPEPPKGE